MQGSPALHKQHHVLIAVETSVQNKHHDILHLHQRQIPKRLLLATSSHI